MLKQQIRITTLNGTIIEIPINYITLPKIKSSYNFSDFENEILKIESIMPNEIIKIFKGNHIFKFDNKLSLRTNCNIFEQINDFCKGYTNIRLKMALSEIVDQDYIIILDDVIIKKKIITTTLKNKIHKQCIYNLYFKYEDDEYIDLIYDEIEKECHKMSKDSEIKKIPTINLKIIKENKNNYTYSDSSSATPRSIPGSDKALYGIDTSSTISESYSDSDEYTQDPYDDSYDDDIYKYTYYDNNNKK
jgi:hypothetical protein